MPDLRTSRTSREKCASQSSGSLASRFPNLSPGGSAATCPRKSALRLRRKWRGKFVSQATPRGNGAMQCPGRSAQRSRCDHMHGQREGARNKLGGGEAATYKTKRANQSPLLGE